MQPRSSIRSKVRSDAVPGLDLSKMNAFGVRLMRELPLRQLPHKKLSEARPSGRLGLNLSPGAGETRVTTVTEFEILSCGVLHAFAFWFVQNLGTGCELGAGPADTGHWRQAAVVIDPPRECAVGQIFRVEVSVGIGVNGGVDICMVD